MTRFRKQQRCFQIVTRFPGGTASSHARFGVALSELATTKGVSGFWTCLSFSEMTVWTLSEEQAMSVRKRSSTSFRSTPSAAGSICSRRKLRRRQPPTDDVSFQLTELSIKRQCCLSIDSVVQLTISASNRRSDPSTANGSVQPTMASVNRKGQPPQRRTSTRPVSTSPA